MEEKSKGMSEQAVETTKELRELASEGLLHFCQIDISATGLVGERVHSLAVKMTQTVSALSVDPVKETRASTSPPPAASVLLPLQPPPLPSSQSYCQSPRPWGPCPQRLKREPPQ